MSNIYDNWERLVAAVLRKQQLWQLFHEQSRSPSILSETSSSSSSPFRDVDFAIPGSSSTYRQELEEAVAKSQKLLPKLVVSSHFRPVFDVGRGTFGRYPLPRTNIYACSECGVGFPKIESLEHHQAVRHAVSELGPEDSSLKIVEIIFKSSWLKKDNPICKIERILKVHNTQCTIQRFEDYREAVKTRATSNIKRNARCAADGNELLRFHSASLTCSLGARGSTSLCGSMPTCGVCTIIRHGFHGNKVSGTRTTASSGRAHDCLGGSDARRAMLVCRVIAGRVKRVAEDVVDDEDTSTAPEAGSYDSVAGYTGVYSNLEELFVFHSRAILPCFVVIYKALES